MTGEEYMGVGTMIGVVRGRVGEGDGAGLLLPPTRGKTHAPESLLSITKRLIQSVWTYILGPTWREARLGWIRTPPN